MASPTPKTPIVVNDNGTVSILVYEGRTFRFPVTYDGLVDSSGYKARFGFSADYGSALLASADSEDGSITFTQVLEGGIPTATLITVTIPDEDMAFTAKKGKLDMVLEEPGGAETSLVVGDWILWYEVTP